jgi:site-specific DNA-methyltransferase (adenine-specific)
MVLDPFCGCATTCVAAQQLGRKWIDIAEQSVGILMERLSDDAGLFKDFIATTKNTGADRPATCFSLPHGETVSV